MSDAHFIRRLLLAVLVLGLVALLWQLRFVVILAFGSILLAVILRTIATPLRHRFKLPDQVALSAAVLLIVVVASAAFYLFGAEVARQATDISASLPAALEQLNDLAERIGLDEGPEQWVRDLGVQEWLTSNIGGMLMSVSDAVTNLVILIFGGIFLAARPQLYRTGLIKLAPPAGRGQVARALDHCGTALVLWFKGRLLAMVFVGLITGFGLWLLGIPSFLALAVLAATLEFIPFFGPVLAAIPAILLALLIGPEQALMVAALLLVIQQAEGNLITPLIQHRAVDLPPAILLFSLLAFGLLFGLIGILLAEPLTVALFVLIKQLYVRGALKTDTPMPGDGKSR